jgi:hypothetical protein
MIPPELADEMSTSERGDTAVVPVMYGHRSYLGFHRGSFIFHTEQGRRCNQCRL